MAMGVLLELSKNIFEFAPRATERLILADPPEASLAPTIRYR